MKRCASCGRLAFPPRLWCPDCGAGEWRDAEWPAGIVETAAEGIATIALDGGPPVLARLDDDAAPGTRVTLGADAGVAVATPADRAAP
jgi:uncharacterized OB-fold protein